MIYPDAEPIDHISPYKRIELGAKPKKPEPKWVPVVITPICEAIAPQIEEILKDIYCG